MLEIIEVGFGNFICFVSGNYVRLFEMMEQTTFHMLDMMKQDQLDRNHEITYLKLGTSRK
jgi:hypothetical protein